MQLLQLYDLTCKLEWATYSLLPLLTLPQVRVLDRSLLQSDKWIVKTDDACMKWSELDGRVIDFGGMQFGDAGPPLSALVCAIHMQAALVKAVNYTWIEKVRACSPYPCHHYTNSYSISLVCWLVAGPVQGPRVGAETQWASGPD